MACCLRPRFRRIHTLCECNEKHVNVRAWFHMCDCVCDLRMRQNGLLHRSIGGCECESDDWIHVCTTWVVKFKLNEALYEILLLYYNSFGEHRVIIFMYINTSDGRTITTLILHYSVVNNYQHVKANVAIYGHQQSQIWCHAMAGEEAKVIGKILSLSVCVFISIIGRLKTLAIHS